MKGVISAHARIWETVFLLVTVGNTKGLIIAHAKGPSVLPLSHGEDIEITC